MCAHRYALKVAGLCNEVTLCVCVCEDEQIHGPAIINHFEVTIYVNYMHTLGPLDLFIYSQDGQTPLLLAVRKRNIAIVRELLGAEVALNHMEKVRTCIPSFFNHSLTNKYEQIDRGACNICVCSGRTLCSDVVL